MRLRCSFTGSYTAQRKPTCGCMTCWEKWHDTHPATRSGNRQADSRLAVGRGAASDVKGADQATGRDAQSSDTSLEAQGRNDKKNVRGVAPRARGSAKGKAQ